MVIGASPVRKCPGVNGVISDRSSLICDICLKLMQVSIWAVTIDISSYVRIVFPGTLFKWNLMSFTLASHSPPKLGADAGMWCQVVLSLASRFSISERTCPIVVSNWVISSLFPATKFVALSLHMSLQHPRATKRSNAATKYVQ